MSNVQAAVGAGSRGSSVELLSEIDIGLGGAQAPNREAVAEDDEELASENDSDNDTGGAALYKAALSVFDEPSSSDVEEVVKKDVKAPYLNRKVRQQPRHASETFVPHPADPSKVIATFRENLPNGAGVFTQIDEIPELKINLHSGTPLTENIVPDPNQAKIPRKVRAKKNQPLDLWVDSGVDNVWTRSRVVNGEDEVESFRPTIIFRRFDQVTHKYEQAYVSTSKLDNIDPNDKAWMYSYNKWIDQLNRRRNVKYKQKVTRDHWTVRETRALYIAINAFCSQYGVHEFGCNKGARMSDAVLKSIADAVNLTADHDRNIDSVRGKVNTAHAKKDKPLFYLRLEAIARREYMAEGGILSDDETYPLDAILKSDFPAKESDSSQSDDESSLAQTGSVSSAEPEDTSNAAMEYEVGESSSPSSSPKKRKRSGLSQGEESSEDTPSAKRSRAALANKSEEDTLLAQDKKRAILKVMRKTKGAWSPTVSKSADSQRASASQDKTSTTAADFTGDSLSPTVTKKHAAHKASRQSQRALAPAVPADSHTGTSGEESDELAPTCSSCKRKRASVTANSKDGSLSRSSSKPNPTATSATKKSIPVGAALRKRLAPTSSSSPLASSPPVVRSRSTYTNELMHHAGPKPTLKKAPRTDNWLEQLRAAVFTSVGTQTEPEVMIKPEPGVKIEPEVDDNAVIEVSPQADSWTDIDSDGDSLMGDAEDEVIV